MKKRLLSLFLVCKSRNRGELKTKIPHQTDFFGVKWDFGREFLASWREKHPEKGDFCPKSGRIGRKRAVLGRKSREGMKRKIGLYYWFCNAMKWQNGCKWIFIAFFFGQVLQGMQKYSTFALAIGKQRSCKRGMRSDSRRGSKSAAVIFESLT